MYYREKLHRLEYRLHKRLEYKTLELEKAVKCNDETARITALSSAHEISYLICEIERILNENVQHSNRNDNRIYNWLISRKPRQQNKENVMHSFNSDFHKIMLGKFASNYLKGVNTLMYTQKPLTPVQEIIFQRTLTSSLESIEEVRKIKHKMRA